MAKSKGLAKGLDTLIPTGVTIPSAMKETKTPETAAPAAADGVKMVSITKVEPNRDQPRKAFDKEALQELSDSIKQYGLIEPIIVQAKKNQFEIIAGERRWRAAMAAGLKEVPVIVKNYTNQEILEISLIENLQREDLNPIEEAVAYKKLMTEFSLTQEQVAEKVSKSRAAVTNSMRLLKLSEKIQQQIISGELSSGHARALLSLNDEKAQDEIADKTIKNNLSVRDVEKLVKEYGQEKKPEKPVIDESLLNVYRDVEEKLKERLNTKVKIQPNAAAPGSGRLEIDFYSSDDLEQIMEIFKHAK